MALEHLEDRLLLSHFGSTPVLLDDGLLVAELGNSDDVVLFEFPDATTARLTINGTVYGYAQSAIRELSISAGGGNDRVEISAGVNLSASVWGDDGNDTLVGGAGPDSLFSGLGADSLSGGTGDDELSVKPGDTALGGDGADKLFLSVTASDGPDLIAVDNPDAATTRLTLNGVTYDYDRSELAALAIDAGAGNDLVALSSDFAIGAVLFGGDGDDTLLGGAGADSLFSGLGFDSLDGGAGDDSLFAKPGDAAVGGDGNDTLVLAVTGTSGPDVSS